MSVKFNVVELQELAAEEKKAIISGPFGSNISSKFFLKDGIPVIRGNNLSLSNAKFIDSGFAFISQEKAEEINCYAILNDIVFTAAGTIGQVGLIEKKSKYPKYVISNKQMRVRLNPDKINPYYAYYWLSSPWVVKDLINKNTGSTVPLINLGIIKSIKVSIPFLREEQDKIAAVLSALDEKIEFNNRINAELEAMAKTLYDYWFVQFDFPDQNGKPYKSSGGKMVYNDTLKRGIPEGWNVKELGNVAQTSLGGTPSTKNIEYWNEANIAWLSSAETANFPVVNSEQRITQKGLENSAAILLPKGSVVVSIVRYIRPSIIGIDAATNQSVVGIRENEKLKKSFFYPFICSEVPRLMSLRTGAQQPHINKGVIDEILLVIPSEYVLEEYYKIAEPIFEGIITRAFETQQFTELRDWLLPMLMNGQATVA